jgi:hypothetical protein
VCVWRERDGGAVVFEGADLFGDAAEGAPSGRSNTSPLITMLAIFAVMSVLPVAIYVVVKKRTAILGTKKKPNAGGDAGFEGSDGH